MFAKKRNSHSHFRYIKNIKLYLRIVVLVLSLCVHPKEIYYFLSTSHCATLSCLISTGRKFMSRWNVFLHFIASVELGWSWSFIQLCYSHEIVKKSISITIVLIHTCKNLIPMVVTRAMANCSKNHALLMCRIWKMGWNLFSSLDIRENPLFVLFPP